MPTEKRLFLNGMDKDSDERAIEQGWYRNALDFRITDYNNGQAVNAVSIKGNTLMSYTLNNGLNKVIGGYDDKTNQCAYVFIWNSQNNDLVLKYNYITRAMSKIIGGNLGFEQDMVITGADVVQNRFLMWVDNATEPKVVDLNRLSDYPTITTSNSYYIELIKPYTIEPILAAYNSNKTYNQNNLNNLQYKFRTRIIYKGGFKSVPSTISNCPIPVNTYKEYVETNTPVTDDNEIVLRVPKPTSEAVYVEVLAQSGSDDASMGTWKIIETIDVASPNVNDYDSSGNYYEVVFRNDGIYNAIDDTEAVQLYSRIPLAARAMAQIEENRLLFANTLEGYDQVANPQITLTPVYESYPSATTAGISVASPFTLTSTWAFATGTAGVPTNNAANIPIIANGYRNNNFGFSFVSGNSVGSPPAPTFREIGITGTSKAGDLISLSLTVTVQKLSGGTNSQTFTVEYLVSQDGTSNADIAQGLATAINSADTRVTGYGLIAFTGTGAYSNIVYVLRGLSYDSQYVLEWTGTSTVSNISNSISQPSHKKGATHQYGIQYVYNGGRLSPVLTEPSAVSYVTMDNEVGVGAARGRVTMQLSINHTPPTGAIGYYPVHKQQRKVQDFLYWRGKIGIDANGTYINLNEIKKFNSPISGNTFATSTSVDWSFTQNDRIVIIRDANAGENINGVYDFRIKHYDVTTNNVYIDADITTILNESGNPITDPDDIIFKLYRPEKEVEVETWNEIGHYYEISGGYHTGNNQNQTSSQPAIIDINDYGDVYFKQRVFPASTSPLTANITFFVESKNISDFYFSSATSAGRANVENKNFEQTRYETRVRYTERFIPSDSTDTSVNGMSLIFGGSLEDYTREYGSIQYMLSKTRRALIFFERKKGFIPIGEEVAGDSLTFRSDRVLNNIQYYSGDYGIGQNPEAVAVFGNSVYSVDPYRGTVNRLAENGDTPISQYKMRGEFNNKLSSAIKKGLTPEIWGVYNKNFDEYILSIKEKVVCLPSGSGGNGYGDFYISDVNANAILISNPLSTFYLTVSIQQAQEYAVGDYLELQYTNGGVSNSVTVQVSSNDNYNSLFNVLQVTTLYIGSPVSDFNATSLDRLQKYNYNVYTFNEERNAWTHKHQWKADALIEAGLSYVAGKDGATYQQDDNDLRCNYFGTQYYPSIDVVFNEMPSDRKLLKNIQLEANTTLISNSGITTSGGQQSSIAEADFSQYEEIYFAPFLKDENTPNMGSLSPLIEGDDLKGLWSKLSLTKQSTDEIKIFSLGVNYVPLNLSNDE